MPRLTVWHNQALSALGGVQGAVRFARRKDICSRAQPGGAGGLAIGDNEPAESGWSGVAWHTGQPFLTNVQSEFFTGTVDAALPWVKALGLK